MKKKYPGSCHCTAVKFEVQLPDEVESERCNCSICAKSGLLHVIIPKRDFTLLSGEDVLSTYTFNTGAAKHTFCKICGIKAFYTPRSNPDGVSVNLNCLDKFPPKVRIVDFDGQNWEQNAHTLAHKSK
ncbi:GFA family protein [Glaciecola siphonariae]|uniref:GFA family protein n=1 Tax=Glaciecola siphonariae TaxID=521012 RepID=A0ABV9LQH9_9ALTE